MTSIVRGYLEAFGKGFTYDVRRNVYLLFGFLWGLPIPIVSIALDLHLSFGEGRDPWTAVVEHPVHLFFLAHPPLFALIFGAMGTLRQILQEQNERLIRTLTEQASTDALTGLHNRRYVLEELEKALRRARRGDARFSVLLFDLDGFKAVNDTRGHPAGDLVLKQAAGALLGIIRDGDVLGRYGGDEFLLLCFGDTSTHESIPARADQAVLEKAGLGVSTGIAFYPDDGRTAADLVDQADLRLARDKKDRYARKGTRRYGSEPQKSPLGAD